MLRSTINDPPRGSLDLRISYPKKSLDLVNLNQSQKRQMVETLFENDHLSSG